MYVSFDAPRSGCTLYCSGCCSRYITTRTLVTASPFLRIVNPSNAGWFGPRTHYPGKNEKISVVWTNHKPLRRTSTVFPSGYMLGSRSSSTTICLMSVENFRGVLLSFCLFESCPSRMSV